MTVWAWLGLAAAGVLVWTWVLYPFAISIVSKAFPAPTPQAPAAWPTVTAILATRDDLPTIVARVEDFFAGDYPAEHLSVVVGVDSGTPEQCRAIAAALAPRAVVVVPADPGGGKAAGLNAAVRAATGDILVFSDAQQRFAPDAIRRLVCQLTADPRLAAIGGALQLPGDAPDAGGRTPVEWYWHFERLLRAAEARVHSTVGVSGSIYALWRRYWAVMPSQLILDDVWLPMHLVLSNQRVGYDLNARAWDVRRTDAQQEGVRKVRTLTGNFQLVAWLPMVLVPGRNPIWLQFLSHKLLRLLTPWLLLAIVVGMSGAVVTMLSPEVTIRLAAALLLVTLGALLVAPTRRIVMRAAGWGWSLQVAVVQATRNGLTGRWDVWR